MDYSEFISNPTNAYSSIENDPYRKAYALAIQLKVGFGISIWCFHPESLRMVFAATSENAEELLAFLNISGGLNYAYDHKDEKRPIFLNDPFGMAWLCEWFTKEGEEGPAFLIVLGPVLTGANTAPNLMYRLRERNFSPALCDSILDIMSKLPIINPAYLVNFGLMLHVTLTGETIKPADCLYQSDQAGEPEPVAELQQNNDSRILEEYLKRVVREGDVPALEQIHKVTASTQMHEMGLSRDLRSMKNTFIILNALCSREAMDAGVPPRTALSVERHYITAIEAAGTAVDLIRILLTFAEEYTTRVRKVKYDEKYSKEHRLLAEVRLQYADGTVETVGTDESWVTWPSNITYSTIYDGEYVDDTLMPEAPEAVRLLEEEMLPLSDRYSPPVRIQQLIRPVALLHTPAGEQVFDLGQNMSGVFRLRIRGEKGQKVHIQVGEVLQEGNFYRENLRSAKAEFFYTCGGEQVTIQPKFTYYGFRYVKVEGVEVAENDLEGLVYYSDMEEIGFLTTGHEKVNRLISNAHWGLRGNFLDVPTDCPQRDERMGWTGDAQVFSGTANFFRNTYNFYRKYLHDMDTEQQDLAGKVPIVVPSFGYTDTACVWGDAATIMPWNLYLFTGDTAILQEQYGSMKGWVDHLVAFDGDDRRWGQAFHYGDWLALDHANRKSDQVMGGTAEDYIAYVYLGHSAGLVSKAAALLGREEEAAHYAALKEEIYDYVRHEYFTPGGRCAADTQTAYLIALRYGVAPDREKAIAMLKKTFTRNEGKLQTGFVGSPHLCNVLTEVGMEKLSYDLLLNEDYPGWLYAVNLGATTIWERWNSMEADGSVSSTGMNSFNHYSYGSICEWMFRHVAGLNPLESAPGFRKVEIKPVPDPRLGHINMEYRSISGTYRVSWQVEGKRHVVLDVTVPFGCEAELTLYRSEEAPMVLTAGVYHFEYDTVTSMGAALSMDSKLWELFDDPEAAEILRQFDVGTFSIPTQHWNDTLRQIAGTAEGNVSQAQAAAIDEMLKKL